MVSLVTVTVLSAFAGTGRTGLPDVPPVRQSSPLVAALGGTWPRPTNPYRVSRRLARRRFEESVTTLRLYRQVLTANSRFDVNSAFNFLHVYEEATTLAADVIGEGEELIPWLEARVAAARWVETGLEPRAGQADVPDESVIRKVRARAEQRLRELKERINRR